MDILEHSVRKCLHVKRSIDNTLFMHSQRITKAVYQQRGYQNDIGLPENHHLFLGISRQVSMRVFQDRHYTSHAGVDHSQLVQVLIPPRYSIVSAIPAPPGYLGRSTCFEIYSRRPPTHPARLTCLVQYLWILPHLPLLRPLRELVRHPSPIPLLIQQPLLSCHPHHSKAHR